MQAPRKPKTTKAKQAQPTRTSTTLKSACPARRIRRVTRLPTTPAQYSFASANVNPCHATTHTHNRKSCFQTATADCRGPSHISRVGEKRGFEPSTVGTKRSSLAAHARPVIPRSCTAVGRCLEQVAVEGDDFVSNEDLSALLRSTARDDLAHKEFIGLRAPGAGRARTLMGRFCLSVLCVWSCCIFMLKFTHYINI